MYNLSINWTHCHTQRTVAAASEVSVLALSVWLHVPLSTSSRYANEAQAVQKADYVGGHGTQLMAICFAAAVSLAGRGRHAWRGTTSLPHSLVTVLWCRAQTQNLKELTTECVIRPPRISSARSRRIGFCTLR